MYNNASNELKSIVKGNTITSTARLTFKNFFSEGNDLVLQKDNITQNGLTISDYCYNDKEGKLIGTAMTKELEIEIKNNENYNLQDKIFDFEVGILIDRENLAYEYIPYGAYIVTSYEDLKSSKKYKIIAYDLMSKLNSPYIENTSFKPTYPITLKNYYKEFMASYGIEVEEQTLPNENFMIYSELNFEGYTGRKVLSHIAELFGSFVKINRNNKAQMYLKTETNEIIYNTQMNSKLEIDQEYGPVNVVTVGLSQVEGENVTLADYESIEQYGETTIRIDDNPFIYTEELREQVIQDLYDRLRGFRYIPVSFKYKALMYSDCGDSIKVENIQNGELVETIILNQTIKLPKTRQSTIESKALTNSEQKNKYISNTKQAQTRTEILVNKHEKNIASIVQEIGDRSEKTTSITEDIDGINAQVSNIVDITNTIDGTSKIEILDAKKGQLLELHIYGNNTVFRRLFVSPETYVSPNTVLKGKSRIKVTDENGNVKYYDIPIEKGLKQNGDVYDEFVIMRGKSQLIQRISEEGSVLIEPIVTDFKEIEILLNDGKNTIEIVYYTANMSAKYVTQTEFTDIYATKVEMSSAISESATEIEANVTKVVKDEAQVLQEQISELEIATGNISLEVSEATAKTEELEGEVKDKISMEEIIAKLNLAIKEGQGIIEITGNQVIINSDNYTLTADGEMTATAGEIGGFNISAENLSKDISSTYMYTMEDVILLLNYLKGLVDLPNGLLELYDVNGDGSPNIADVQYMLNIISGIVESPKTVNGQISINPNEATDTLLIKSEYDDDKVKTTLGMFNMYSYIMRTMNLYVGEYTGSKFEGVTIDSKNRKLTVTDGNYTLTMQIDNSGRCEILPSTGNVIFPDSNVIAVEFIASGGKCMHGVDGSHTYRCHWTGTQLQFYVDNTNVGTLSDKRLKTEIKDIDETLINAIKDLGFKQFKLLNRNGKISLGIIAQDLIKVFENNNLKIDDYDFIGKAQYELDDKEEYYIVNYEQFMLLHSKFLRNKVDSLEERISKLEKILLKEE